MRKHIYKSCYDGAYKISDGGALKYVNSYLLLTIMSVLLVSAFLPLSSPTASNAAIHEATPVRALSYTPHDYIFIVGDAALEAQAAAESWPGDGSSGTPFLIQGYEFYNMESLILLADTRLHVRIVDCNLTFAESAIFLSNTSNVEVENCIINDAYYGVVMVNVTGINLTNCNVVVHPTLGMNGIYAEDTIDCTVASCDIQGVTDSSAGIYVITSSGFTLFNNTVYEFDNHGIFLGGCSDVDILNNTVFWNEGSLVGPTCGIYVVECLFTYIYGNNVFENEANGITISGGYNTTIIENHIIENWIHGIYVEYSPHCLIQDNLITDNGEGTLEGPRCGIFTLYADYCQIIGNEFWWNAQNSITLFYSDNAYVANNYLNHSYSHGMHIFWSTNATIEENEIHNSYGYGSMILCGVLVESSNGTSLLNNIIGPSSDNGITIVFSNDGFITGNTIFDSEYLGIYLDLAANWEITHNVIFDCGGPAIVLEELTWDNVIYHNDFGWSGEFLAGDMGFGNTWDYMGVGNWYSDYDGEGSYLINGIAGSTDSFPSVSLYSGVATVAEYEAGTLGNTMVWNASALNPGSYEAFIDGVSQGLVAWNGDEIVVNVDGLSVGEYNVTLVVYHVSGHWLANESTLTVVDTLPPTWTVTPEDQILEYNEALSYLLYASDPSGITWSVNDTATFAISAVGLLTNATFLEPGVYYVEVTATDSFAHSITLTIMVTVNAPAAPLNPAVLALAVGGGGAIVVLIIAGYIYKTKRV